jgi:hypothetical protein
MLQWRYIRRNHAIRITLAAQELANTEPLQFPDHMISSMQISYLEATASTIHAR